ncbi:MAG: hypothetical protein ACKO85_15045, partial [Isosphaeraceae bacterium]
MSSADHSGPEARSAGSADWCEFANAAQADDEETALYILETLMSPELAAAVDWWSAQPDDSG